jgi:lipopolysaccharide/colanic/teichoic acid biosynthesis glycosyltransferase
MPDLDSQRFSPLPTASAGHEADVYAARAVCPIFWLDPVPRDSTAGHLKRAMDLIGAVLLLAALAPILMLALLLVKLTSPGPAIFVQRRIGHRCKQFGMFKLRTMVDGAEELEDELAGLQSRSTFLKIDNDPRVTSLGRFLRKYSIDELPQLCNVLRGEMSLVGPRPLLVCDFRKFPKQEQMRRFSVKPGLTGLWQVSGRSLCSDGERIQLDLDYVDAWHLWLDLRILLRTIPAVICGRGAT